MCYTLLWLVILLHFLAASAASSTNGPQNKEFIKGKICIGTNGRLSVPSNKEHHYRNLRDRYMNCTYVDGNLELTWLQDETLDLSFLQYIREVTGYVLISHVDVTRIVLPRLQIIRGRTRFTMHTRRNDEFALLVILSKMYNLELPALRDILAGSVGMLNNYNLCHIKTINWEEIITGPGAEYKYDYNFSSPERQCPKCHENCSAGCWGEGQENCQQFSKINCSPQCYQGRCFGRKPRDCCHLFCAGGCTGPKQSDCLACRNFYDDGVCKQECPSKQRYNPTTYSWEDNPNGKYAYGATCVRTCPEHLLRDNGACVRHCPPNKKAVNGQCDNCDGPCPKTCQGVTAVHSGNIESFRGCTIIEGSLTILESTFAGFQMIYSNFSFGPRHPRMHPDELEVFSTLKEVTGFINIQANHSAFTNLSYFRNLEVIRGRTLTEYFSALYIVKTSLRSLNLRSLQRIQSGSIAILENKDLCFAKGVNWKRIMTSQEHGTLLQNNKLDEACRAEGLVCSSQCSNDGCWGRGPDECLFCEKYKLGNQCVENCNASLGIYESLNESKICKPCHEECKGICTGPGPGMCNECKNVRDGPFCVPNCPELKYNQDGKCVDCHKNCVGGCDGPKNIVGPGGCKSCEKAVLSGEMRVDHCLGKNDPCPDGYYNEFLSPQQPENLKPLEGKAICRKCHPRCKKCSAYGFHIQVCEECVNYKRGEQCEDECPHDHYADEEKHECIPCHEECRGCSGSPTQCLGCRNYRIYSTNGAPENNVTEFNCTASCPPELPHKESSGDGRDPYCAAKALMHQQDLNGETIVAIIGSVAGGLALLGIVGGIIAYQFCQRAKAKEHTMKMTLAMSGYEDNEPLQPSNIKPNLAQLHIVKEEELRRGGILGYGAFGTVYKGVLLPKEDNVKVPVAIKVLHEGTGSNTNREFLEEAYIMATVEHPNLLRLLAVCLASQMMLVTQLMPLGCLLDYIRNNKDNIGSKPLLNWCTQIARGMAYLEEKRLVHRDLAARNVLVQTPTSVKITDFGLAKLLDANEEEYKAEGGKMPIKWLALECIQHRIFTHKSDVWAFGVTVWELLTYGERPYRDTPAREVPELLEKGERLSQPSICTIDVYMIMIKCWMLDAESRPSFKELADEFAKMARDPGRYLAVPGDRFMKLPSYTKQDEHELIRNLSPAMDEPGEVIVADEYFQLKTSGVPRVQSSSGGSSYNPRTPTKKYGPPSSISGSLPPDSPSAPHQNQQNWSRFGPPGNHAVVGLPLPPSQLFHPFNQGTVSSNSSRYCSDPLKLLTKDGDSVTDENSLSAPHLKHEVNLNGLKLELPVDEDDYLLPSPQLTQAATAYMDLIADSKYSGEIDGTKPIPYTAYPDFVHPGNGKPVTSMDNPEYHIMANENGNGNVPGSTPPPNGQQMPSRNGNVLVIEPLPFANPQQRSSEEESDHEYYNDFDRLQRELQPLKPFKRNETTV